MTEIPSEPTHPMYSNESFLQAVKLEQLGKTDGWCPDCKRHYTIVDGHTGETRYYTTPQNDAQKFYRVPCIPCISKQYPL